MYGKNFYLDGITSGIVIINSETGEIVSSKMYTNMQLLEADMYRKGVKNYKLGFLLKGKVIPYYKIQDVNNHYHYQTFIDNDIVDIFPTIKEKVYKAGYFSFTDDPDSKLDYKTGKEINKDLYAIVKTAASYLLKSGEFKTSGIDGVLCNIAPNIGPMKYQVYDNTTTLRIMRGFELVKINESRKNAGQKVLPFLGDKDKYKNIYFCFSKDENEFPGDKKYHETADNIIKMMFDYIDWYHEDLNPQINMVPFYHPIQL